MRRRLLAWSLVVLTAPFAAGAREAPPVGQDPVIEQRMMALAEELRCLVCQNQTLADSHADLAVDLRQEIRELMQKGQSDEQVKRYLVARYGDFVLYRPPLKSSTWLLWFGPAVLLVGGLATLYLVLLRRRRLLAAEPLNEDQEKRALALLSEDEGQPS
ncbi:MAG: cytochrome c-type biogenesis protein CcmH [Betaproteobacteria bacterium]|jgi:cytochrome c-type biogenesis protein CcmH|nr:MAG: cytochrome c-type biogenesis protein CcmH [Betaproteobacteria bacterium]